MKMKKKVALLLAASMVFSALPAYGTGAEELIVPTAEESVEDLTAVNAGDPGGTEVMDAANDGQGIIAEALPEEITADDFTDGEGLAEDISDAAPTDVVAAADTDPANPADNAEAVAAEAGSIPVPEADEPAAEAAIEAVLPDELTVETVEEVAAPEAEAGIPEWNNCQELKLGDKIDLSALQQDEYGYWGEEVFQFTPEEKDDYFISLSGMKNVSADINIYESDNPDVLKAYWSTSALVPGEFYGLSYTLEQGKTYYFEIYFWNENSTNDAKCTLKFEKAPQIVKAELTIDDSCDIVWLTRNIDMIPLKLTYSDGTTESFEISDNTLEPSENKMPIWDMTNFDGQDVLIRTTKTGRILRLRIHIPSSYGDDEYSDEVNLLNLFDKNINKQGWQAPLGRYQVEINELSDLFSDKKEWNFLCDKVVSVSTVTEIIKPDETKTSEIQPYGWKAYSFTSKDSMDYKLTVTQNNSNAAVKYLIMEDVGQALQCGLLPTALKLYSTELPTDVLTGADTIKAKAGGKYYILVLSHEPESVTCSVDLASTCTGQNAEKHNWDMENGTILAEADCKAGVGIIEYHCTNHGCTATKREIIAPGHDFSTEFTTDVEPTCTAKGSKSRHCTREGCTATTEVTEIPMLAHTMTTVIDRQPTCTAVGKKHDECSVCHGNKQPSVDIPMAAHKMVEKRVEPTCAEPGMTYQICSVCGGNRTEPKEIPALAHTMAEKRVEPTCTAPGMTYQECSVCGGNRTEPVEIPALPHQMVTVVDAAPTCDADGSQHNECSVCKGNKSDFTVLPALGHKWMTVTDANPTCGGAGSQHDVCTVCAAVGPAVAIPATGEHVFGKYVTSKTSTALREGEEVRTCSVCGHKETRKIAALEPTIKTNAGNIPMQVGQTTSGLKVKGLASGDSIKSWSSSRTSIVKVDQNGRLTAQHKVGSAVIVITLDSGHTKFVYVNVQKGIVKTQKITNVPSKLTIKKGKTRSLKPHLTPFTSQQKLTYKSSNKKVATVNEDGVITAVGPGTAKITVKSGKQKVTVRVTVPKIRTKKIRNVKKSVTLKVGGSFRLNPVTSPVNSDNKLTYSSSDKKIAAVSRKGRITAKKPGKAVITVKSGKIKKKCTVTVRRK